MTFETKNITNNFHPHPKLKAQINREYTHHYKFIIVKLHAHEYKANFKEGFQIATI